jgi:hypothetical protein
MRPISKGTTPQVNGTEKVVSDYKDWRGDLVNQLGNYCCYCNMVLNDSPQVEHVVPQLPQAGHPAGAALAWENLLLACGPCNRAKSNQPVSTSTHYLPDVANTHLAFQYIIVDYPQRPNSKGCIPIPRNVPGVIREKANETIALCRLDFVGVNPRVTDLRWKYRFEAWYAANALWKPAWEKWGCSKSADFIPLLIDTASAKGFFSIWFEAFDDVPDVKSALIAAFPGTHRASFSAAPPYSPQFRNSEDTADPI